MNDAELDRKLQQQIDELPKALKPSRDLWAGIDHAIESQQQYRTKPSKVYQLFGVAAGFAVLGLSAWMYMQSSVEPLPTQNQELVAEVPAPLQYIDELSTLFEQRKQTLLVKYQDNPTATQDWKLQLEQLDKAALVIKQALVNDPTNAQLIKMLQQTYQQQIDLIEAVNRSPWQSI